jgi:hypothetical protein
MCLSRQHRIAAWSLLGVASVGLLAAVWTEAVTLSLVEVFGFATGAAGVMLVVEQKTYNRPKIT